VSGLLAIKRPWPGMARTVQNDHTRFVESNLATLPEAVLLLAVPQTSANAMISIGQSGLGKITP